MNFIKVIGTTISGVARAILTDPDGRVNVAYEVMDSGRQTVTTVGTRVRLTTVPTPASLVMLTAETDNTGIITYGGSQVDAALATRKGFPLSVGQSSPWIPVSNLSNIWLDTTVNTDGVTYIVLR